MLLVFASAAWSAGCGSSAPSPGEIAQNYVSAVAEGNYAGACALLDAQARDSLAALMRSRAKCHVLLARCLPANASVLGRDQVQLLYATVETSITGSHSTVSTSGTRVANRIRELTLVKEQGRWVLASYGRQRCRR